MGFLRYGAYCWTPYKWAELGQVNCVPFVNGMQVLSIKLTFQPESLWPSDESKG